MIDFFFGEIFFNMPTKKISDYNHAYIFNCFVVVIAGFGFFFVIEMALREVDFDLHKAKKLNLLFNCLLGEYLILITTNFF